MPLALSPNSIGSKDPHALKIPARKGGIRLTSENAAVAVHADRDDGVCPDRSSRKPRSLRQVESKERCSSSEPLWISGPPSSWITLRRSRSADLSQGRIFVQVADDLAAQHPKVDRKSTRLNSSHRC